MNRKHKLFACMVALALYHSDQIAALQTSVGKEHMLRIVTSMSGPVACLVVEY